MSSVWCIFAVAIGSTLCSLSEDKQQTDMEGEPAHIMEFLRKFSDVPPIIHQSAITAGPYGELLGGSS